MDELISEIKKAICHVTKVTEKDITIDSNLADVGVDSFAGIDLVYTLEDALNIKISDEEMRQIKTVRDVLDLVQKKKEGKE